MVWWYKNGDVAAIVEYSSITRHSIGYVYPPLATRLDIEYSQVRVREGGINVARVSLTNP